MFAILAKSIGLSLYCMLSGSIYSKIVKYRFNHSTSQLCTISIFGMFFLGLISLLLNFFFPLSLLINNVVLFLILIISFIYKSIKIDIKVIKFSLIIGFISFILICLSNINRPDAGLYHYPFISLLNDNKIIIGVTNLHTRFGLTSIIQYISALNYNSVFGLNGIVIPLATLASLIFLYFFSEIINFYKSRKDTDLYTFFIFFTFIFFSYKMNRYSGYGNDAPGHFLLFFLISILLKNNENFKNQTFIKVLTISIFIFINKITLFVALIFPFIIIKFKDIKAYFRMEYLLPLSVLVLWFVKNILNTGCIIYPIENLCFEFRWSNFDYTNNISYLSTGAEAWSKSWPELSDKQQNVIGFYEFNSNFNWVSTWLSSHFLFIIKTISPYFLFITSLALTIMYLSTKKKENKIFDRKIFIIFLLIFIGTIGWFLKAPVYRFGYSYIIITINLIFSIFLFKNFELKNNQKIKKLILYVTIIFLLAFMSKQFLRIEKKWDSNYTNYPWPKYFSFNQQNQRIELKTIEKNNKIYYYMPLNTLCFYSLSPCTHEEPDKQLEMSDSFGYKIFYFKK